MVNLIKAMKPMDSVKKTTLKQYLGQEMRPWYSKPKFEDTMSTEYSWTHAVG
jgi:hypothetical protein